jgi:hypothetical protein
MIADLTFQLAAPDYSDSPQVLVPEASLRFAISAAPNPGPFAVKNAITKKDELQIEGDVCLSCDATFHRRTD